MNPEDNNPLTNPGAPGMDPMNNSAGSFSASNDYASPEMGASFAVQGAATSTDLGSIGEVVNNGFESTDTTLEPAPADTSVPADEPLVPAAPVPGSIGSAISAPPANAAPAAPTAAPAFNAGTPAMGNGPMPAPAVAPQAAGASMGSAAPTQPAPAAAGFTPFGATSPATPAAQPVAPTATPAKTPTPASTSTAAPGINPAFQPAAKTKKAGFSFELGSKRTSIILLVVAALFMVATVVMTALYFQAANKPEKIVYTPSPSQTPNQEVLRCSGEDNFGYLVGSESPIMGTRSLTASYINGVLGGLTASFSISFPDEGLAIAGKDALAAEQTTLLSNIGNSFISNYWTYGNTAEAIISTRAGFENKDAIMFLYGLTDSETSTDLETLQEKYESEGLVCEVK